MTVDTALATTRSPAQLALTVGALGVVFGDIGTSPIYTVQTISTRLSRARENGSAPRNVSVSWQCAEQRVSDPASTPRRSRSPQIAPGDGTVLLSRSPAEDPAVIAPTITARIDA